ncbi:MAG: helix-turn-helix domain-containing protein [Acidimicrobiales bacterium]
MRIKSAKDLADAVRGRRAALGWSQAFVAERAGVSRPWLSHVEAGKITTEIGLVIRLLYALQLRLDVVEDAAGTGTTRDSPVDLDALLEELRSR